MAAYLIDRYDLHGKTIIEIGCGKGDYLRLLCKLGENRGIGFDPTYIPEQKEIKATKERITFIQNLYSPKYAHYQADFICCRHVLEHIPSPRKFLNGVRNSIDERTKTPLFFEVPNVLYTLRDMGIWDLIYEHCSYFSSYSLSYLFTLCGFNVCKVKETYGGQYLCLEAQPYGKTEEMEHTFACDIGNLKSDVLKFAEKYRLKIKGWRDRFRQIQKEGKKFVVWGAGSKGVSFLNILESQEAIRYVVDINTRKQGKYIAGTGQLIVPPNSLREIEPEVIIIMNPIYKDEIQHITDRVEIKNADYMYA